MPMHGCISLAHNTVANNYEHYTEKSENMKCKEESKPPVVNNTRKFTFSGDLEKFVPKKRKRLNSGQSKKFPLGGNRSDPLNLQGLVLKNGEENRLNDITTIVSPRRSPRSQIQVLVPPNISDPLNLFHKDLKNRRKRSRRLRLDRKHLTLEEKIENFALKDLPNKNFAENCEFDIFKDVSNNLVTNNANQHIFNDGNEMNEEDIKNSVESSDSANDENIIVDLEKTFNHERKSDNKREEIKEITYLLNYLYDAIAEYEKSEPILQNAIVETVLDEKSYLKDKNLSTILFDAFVQHLDSHSDFDKDESADSSEHLIESNEPIGHENSTLPESITRCKNTENNSPQSSNFFKEQNPVNLQNSQDLLLQNNISKNISFDQPEIIASGSETPDRNSNSSQQIPYSNSNDTYVRKPKNKKRYLYGNYERNPMNWNFGGGCFGDPRYNLLNIDFFKNKDVLDIGCGSGDITMFIAKNFKPKSVTGLDIDENLIKQAQKKVRKELSMVVSSEHRFPEYMASMFGSLVKMGKADAENSFPNNVTFVKANFVPDSEDDLENQTPKYDTILCLRVTKWIHLNFGDRGLKLAFKRMFKQLRCGGYLILEPQPWFTYAISSKKSPEMASNYRNIWFMPDDFCDYLLYEVGLQSCDILGRTFNCKEGYEQPLYLFVKGNSPDQNMATKSPSSAKFSEEDQ